MPSPTLHIEVMFKVAEALQLPLSVDLILGCISPDAIHMRLNQTWADKSRTHFYDVANDDFIEAINVAKQTLQDVSSDFRRGYLIHLYTDYLWRDKIYTPYFHKYKDIIKRSDLHALYYRDMKRIDAMILLDTSKAICYLQDSVSKPCYPLLGEKEIEQWRLKVLEDDLNSDKIVTGELEVFSMSEINLFIAECCENIIAQFQVFLD